MATEKRQPSPRYVRLASLADVRAEMARSYRLANDEKILWGEATRRIHCLSQVARLIELEGEAERRAQAEQESHEILEAHGLIGSNGKLLG